MESIQQALAVLAVLGLLAGTLWWLKRKGLAAVALGRRGGAGRRLELMERLPLTPHHSLHLVRIGERAILIAVSPSGCSVIDAPAETALRKVL